MNEYCIYILYSKARKQRKREREKQFIYLWKTKPSLYFINTPEHSIARTHFSCSHIPISVYIDLVPFDTQIHTIVIYFEMHEWIPVLSPKFIHTFVLMQFLYTLETRPNSHSISNSTQKHSSSAVNILLNMFCSYEMYFVHLNFVSTVHNTLIWCKKIFNL